MEHSFGRKNLRDTGPEHTNPAQRQYDEEHERKQYTPFYAMNNPDFDPEMTELMEQYEEAKAQKWELIERHQKHMERQEFLQKVIQEKQNEYIAQRKDYLATIEKIHTQARATRNKAKSKSSKSRSLSAARILGKEEPSQNGQLSTPQKKEDILKRKADELRKASKTVEAMTARIKELLDWLKSKQYAEFRGKAPPNWTVELQDGTQINACLGCFEEHIDKWYAVGAEFQKVKKR